MCDTEMPPNYEPPINRDLISRKRQALKRRVLDRDQIYKLRKDYRENTSLTLASMAKELGVSVSTISNALAGVRTYTGI